MTIYQNFHFETIWLLFKKYHDNLIINLQNWSEEIDYLMQKHWIPVCTSAVLNIEYLVCSGPEVFKISPKYSHAQSQIKKKSFAKLITIWFIKQWLQSKLNLNKFYLNCISTKNQLFNKLNSWVFLLRQLWRQNFVK